MVTPRAAGVIGMVVALPVVTVAGIVIANPPLTIPGAIILLGGTLLFSVAATWTVLKSWAEVSWWAETGALGTSLGRSRGLANIKVIAAALFIAIGVWLVIEDGSGWIIIAFGVLLLVFQVVVFRRLSNYRIQTNKKTHD